MKFSELFIIGKYVKISFKNRGSPCYFLSSRDQKIKNITNIDQKRLLLFLFLGLFVMAFLVQKLIYMQALWFNFVFRSFFEADHLLSNYFRSLSKKITILIDINHEIQRSDIEWKPFAVVSVLNGCGYFLLL